jgi:hypothetical protein
MTKWSQFPNLRKRPAAPAAGRGRIQVQVRRAFAVHGREVSSSQVYDWTHARNRRMTGGLVHSVRRILREIADPINRARTVGRPWVWKLKQPLPDD